MSVGRTGCDPITVGPLAGGKGNDSMRGAWVKRTAIMIVALCIAGCMFRKLD